MYKFTNGFVVFDEETKNEFLRAGYQLVEEKKDEPIEGQVTIDEAIEETIDEENNIDGSIERKSESSRKTAKSVYPRA